MKGGNFIIIGFTGPLGSGCTDSALFLEKKLNAFKKSLEKEHSKITTTINSYYRFLKQQQDKFNTQKSNFTSETSTPLIAPEKLFELQSSWHGESHHEDQMKKINRKLRSLLVRRKLISSFTAQTWPEFTYISMSSMLLKLIVEDTLDNNGDVSKSFHVYNSGITIGGKERLLAFSREHRPTFVQFNEKINNRESLDQGFCLKMDNALNQLRELKKAMHANKEISSHWLQDMGDNLRGSGHPFNPEVERPYAHLDILAIEVNKIIKYYRRRSDCKKSDFFAIDSFRNPAEVKFFKDRYGSFFLCSLFTSLEKRQARLDSRFDEKVERRDQGKDSSPDEIYKQNVPSCVLLSDYAITNEYDEDHFKFHLARLLCLIKQPGIVPPTTDETFMNFAYSLSLRSTCLSRQVGAVITNTDGYVIAAGWNDVGSGQMGCSLNCISDYNKYSDEEFLLSNWKERIDEFKERDLLDHYKDSQYFCFKDLQSSAYAQRKIEKTYKKIEEDASIPMDQKQIYKAAFDYLKENLSIKRLEYARSLHAEENAILQAARFGGMGISGGTIYTTTYPCELCSKKIYQAQLKRIVYTEPYPEGLSEKIFLKDGIRSIEIEQFQGAKSSCFHRLFKALFDLKESQQIQDTLI